jgi:hypothetical protein
MKTEFARNRKLADQLTAAIRAAGYECTDLRGWPDSLYGRVSGGLDDWSGEIRVSDHQQATGGGYNEHSGERHGESPISIEIDSGPGAGLAIDANDNITHRPWARADFRDDVPDELTALIEPIVALFAKQIARRTAAAKQAAKTKKEGQRAEWTRHMQERAATVCAAVAVAGLPHVAVTPDGFPRIDVPAGTSFRRQLQRELEEKLSQIVKSC